MKTPARVAVFGAFAVLAGAAGALIALALAAGFDWFDSPSRVVPVTVLSSEEGLANSPAEPAGFDAVALYRERSPGVVTIHAGFQDANDPQGLAQGSGFVVSSAGYILTNSHVITTAGLGSTDPDSVVGATEVFVEFVDGERVPAEIVGWDVFTDVGVLQVELADTPVRALPLGVSARVEVGEPVAAIGSPFGQASSLTVGVISAVGRSVASLTSDYDLIDAIQIDAPINRGNSGGPLFNAKGEVIGINAQIRSESGTSEGVGFAIAIDTALNSMEQLIENGTVAYPWIGTCIASLVPNVSQRLGYTVDRGALITTVFADTPASDSGLQQGDREELVDGVRYSVGSDVVTAVDDEAITSAEALIRELSRKAPGETVDLEVHRGGDTLALELTIGERPATAPGVC